MTQLNFSEPPSIGKSMMKALFLPRKGYKQGAVWPQIKGQLGPLAIDQQKYKKYCEVCQIPASDDLPLLYPHVLSSSLHMQILTDKAFPLKLLGAVHLRNKIIVHQNITVNDQLLFKVELKDKLILKGGIEFSFSTQAYSNDKLVWESLTTYYKRGKFGTIDAETSPVNMVTLENTEKVTSWYLNKNLGKAYAKVCNDYNPIHVSKTLAKLFGFKRDVAHGMGVLTTALDRVKTSQIQYPFKNEVIFKGPLFLESEVSVVKSPQTPGRFDVYCGTNNRPSICFSL